jgi:hypothetical protein
VVFGSDRRKAQKAAVKNQQNRYGYVWLKRALGLWLLAFSQTKTKAHSRERLCSTTFIEYPIERHRQECPFDKLRAGSVPQNSGCATNSGE